MHVSAELAQTLKSAGLQWKPTLHDAFSIPDTAVSNRLFVLTDMMAGMEILRGTPAITFHGSVEWALDYVLFLDALWIPTEGQIRIQLENRLPAGARFTLHRTETDYQCELLTADEPLIFAAPTPADAYGQALLSILRQM